MISSKWKNNVAFLMIGQGVTLFGSSLVGFAVLWHVTLQTQSGLMMTFMMIAILLPMFLVSPFAGVLADRYNKKHIINISDAITAAATLILAVVFTLGYDLTVLLLILLAVRSAAQGVQMPAFGALIPELVPEDKLVRVNGIYSTVQSITAFASPALGGVLLAIAPIHLLMYIDVVTAVIGISTLVFLVKVPALSEIKKHKSGLKQYIIEIKEGFGYIKSSPFLQKFLIIAVIFNFAIASTAMTPLLVARNWGEDLWQILSGLLLGAEHRLAISEMGFSAGLILGGIIIAAWGGFKNKNHSFALFTVLAGIGTAGLGLVGNFWVYIVFQGLCAGFLTMREAPQISMLQVNVGKENMGRSMASWIMAGTLTMQLGMVVWGPLSDIISLNWIMVGTGALVALIGITVFFDKTMQEAGSVLP